MIPLFAKMNFKKILKSIGLGVADSLPVVSTLKRNIESNAPDKGTLDVIRLITALTGSLSLAASFYFYGKGLLTFEQLETLIKSIL